MEKIPANKNHKCKFFARNAPWYTKALRILALALPIVISGPILVQFLPSEDLPSEDKETFQKYYKNSIDYSKIKIHDSFLADTFLKSTGAKSVALGSTILKQTDLILDNYYDYIKMHEVAHIWQYQNCGNLIGTLKEAYDRTKIIVSGDDMYNHYAYTLEKDKDLLEYNIEQQASILADYFWFNANGETPLNYKGTKEEKEKQYKNTLSNFLKDPSYIKDNCDFG